MREMKDSGIEWIGEIPNDWSVSRIKYIADIFGRIGFRGYTKADLVDEGEGAISLSPSNINDMDMSYEKCSYISWKKYYESPEIMVKEGDVIFVKTGSSFGKSSFVSDLPMKSTINPQLIIFKNIKINYKLFAYYIATKYIRAMSDLVVVGGTIPTMSQEKIKNFPVLIPPNVSQSLIAKFLNDFSLNIDATAEDIQKEISLLEDYKKSVITEAVTKGLNPDVEMKDSGIEWIGEIPKDWKVIKTKYVADISIGLVTTMTANYVDNLDDGVYLIRNGDIRLNKISKEKMVYISRKFVEQNASRQLLENDIVTVHTGYIGTSAIIKDDFIGSVGFATIQSRPNLNIINERFLCWFYNSSFFIKQCMLHNTGDGRQNLNLYDFVDFYVYQPPLEEQQQIADYLDSKCSEIDTLIADKKRQLDILAEYKKSLIYEYVTGKKEVPVNE